MLETTEAERLATGFIFTEGPLWHPDGFWYFVDLRRNHLHRLTPGQGAGAGQDHDRRQRHDLRPAGPADRLRGRRPPSHPHGCRRQGRDPGRQLQGRPVQPAERRDLSLERLPVFHRPGQAPPLSRARDTRRRRRQQSVGRRLRLSPGAGRRPQRAGALRVPERAGAVAGRAHDVRREHALLAIHPRDQARCGRQHGRPQYLRRPERRTSPAFPMG